MNMNPANLFLRVRVITWATAAIAISVATTITSIAAPISPGNLVIYRVGTGAAALSSAATNVFLDEYAPNGTLVQSIAMPTADSGSNRTLTAPGDRTTEGMITRSTNGSFIIATGYDAAVGTASPFASASSTINRVIGRIAVDGSIDTSTTTTAFSGVSIRSAASVDGNNFWVSGENTGVVYQPLGGSGTGTVINDTVRVLRSLSIYDGQLYESTATSGSYSRIIEVGSGLPTTSTTISQLAGLPTSGNPNQFFMADMDGSPGLDTLYLTDSSGTIQKYNLVGGTWIAKGTIVAEAVRGLTGTVSGTTVTLYATSPTTLWSVADDSGFNTNVTATVTSLRTASANTAFRGIAFAPVPEPSTWVTGLAGIACGGFSMWRRRKRA